VSACRRGLWVLGILTLLFAPARWAESGPDGDDGRTIGAAALAPSFSSSELPRVEPVHAADPRPDDAGRTAPQPTPVLLLVGVGAVATGLLRRRSPVVDRASVLAAAWRWRGPPLLLPLT
jgi:hypothetical protein